MAAKKKKVVKKKAVAKRVAKKKVEAVPKQYGTATPHLIVSPCSEALAFYEKAFGAKTLMRMPMPDGLIAHAEFKIGDSIVMCSDQLPPMDPTQPQTRKSPKNLGGTTGGVMLYVKDIDSFFARAVAAGATVSMPVMDMFWGDRYGQLEDPFGHVWALATHVKDLSPKEMAAAAAAANAGAPPPPAQA